MQAHEKVEKSRLSVFPMVCGSGGRKVGTLKRQVRSHLARWQMKKVHAAVARSTFRCQNVQNTQMSEHFLEVEMLKKCTPLLLEAQVEVKMHKAHHSRTVSGHSWKLRCRKSARRGGAKHINVQKTLFSDRFWTLNCTTWHSSYNNNNNKKYMEVSKVTGVPPVIIIFFGFSMKLSIQLLGYPPFWEAYI